MPETVFYTDEYFVFQFILADFTIVLEKSCFSFGEYFPILKLNNRLIFVVLYLKIKSLKNET